MAWFPLDSKDSVKMLTRWTIAFCRSAKAHLRPESDLQSELQVLPCYMQLSVFSYGTRALRAFALAQPKAVERAQGAQLAVLQGTLESGELEALLAAQHRPNYALQVCQQPAALLLACSSASARALLLAGAVRAGLCLHQQRVACARYGPGAAACRLVQLQVCMHLRPLCVQNLTAFADSVGACERVLKTPIPLSYTRCMLCCVLGRSVQHSIFRAMRRHTSRILMMWVAILPFTLWDQCKYLTAPVAAVIAFLLLGGPTCSALMVLQHSAHACLPLQA